MTLLQTPAWFEGTLAKAAAQATSCRLLLLVCIVDDSKSEDQDRVNRVLGASTVFTKVTKSCVCVRMVRGSENEIMFTKLFPVSIFPSIYFIHSSGNVLLSGKDIIEAKVLVTLMKKTSISDVSSASSKYPHYVPPMSKPTPEAEAEERHTDTINAERYRKMLVQQTSKDAKHIKQLRKDIQDDRLTYQNIHGPPPTISPKPSSNDLVSEQAAQTHSVINKPDCGKGRNVRLRFRVCNGATLSGDFPLDSKFINVRVFLEENLDRARENIEINLTFPHLILGSDVDEKTLKELEMTQTATLLVRFWGCPQSQISGKSVLSRITPFKLVFALLLVLLAAWLSANGFGQASQQDARTMQLIDSTKMSYSHEANSRRNNLANILLEIFEEEFDIYV
ncbi:hypothetical protein LPJ66_009040 [Kickxella alabastrina]|uniref:Uncharacterized protein n=1 Tax=Kickxella alabastrina TaxID=61397 RepID=A0ACC1I6L7_9FUNG|nr:hypothetical protein LPJ66_009040 [Kickxella alabastrina]